MAGVGVHTINTSCATWEAEVGANKSQGIMGNIVKEALPQMSGMFLIEE